MDNKKLPLVEELKSIVFDFEHGKYTVNNCDVGHCSEISVFYTQIVRNDAKLSSEVERNHEKKLKVR